MMLRYLGEYGNAKKIEDALAEVFLEEKSLLWTLEVVLVLMSLLMRFVSILIYKSKELS